VWNAIKIPLQMRVPQERGYNMEILRAIRELPDASLKPGGHRSAASLPFLWGDRYVCPGYLFILIRHTRLDRFKRSRWERRITAWYRNCAGDTSRAKSIPRLETAESGSVGT